MENTKIGTASFIYRPDGSVEYASFKPDIEVDTKKTPDLLHQFKSSLSGKGDDKTIQADASLIMGAWFAKAEEIELADRDKMVITSNVLNCERFANGLAKKCQIQFSLIQRN